MGKIKSGIGEGSQLRSGFYERVERGVIVVNAKAEDFLEGAGALRGWEKEQEGCCPNQERAARDGCCL